MDAKKARHILALLLLAAAGCAPEEKPPLRIGINFWLAHEFLFLAQEKGFFDEAAAPVELIEYSSLADTSRGFERGQIDVIACTLIEVLQIRDRSSLKPQVFLILDFSNGADVIVARPPIDSVAGLKGRRVAAETNSLGLFVLGRALEEAGLSLADVTLIPKDQSGMQTALAKGEVDGAVTFPPVSVDLLNQGLVNQVFSSVEIPGEVVDVLAVRQDVIHTRRDALMKILGVWDRALAYAAENPDEAYGIMGRREKMSAVDFREALNGIQLLPGTRQWALIESGKLEKTAKATQRFLLYLGMIKGRNDLGDIFARDVHRAALQP
jgi:NitT/TauT family transport system substrate-binding protein